MIVGYITYILINGATGDLWINAINLVKMNCPQAFDAISSTTDKWRGIEQRVKPADQIADNQIIQEESTLHSPNPNPRQDEIAYTVAVDSLSFRSPSTPLSPPPWSPRSPNATECQAVYMLDDQRD